MNEPRQPDRPQSPDIHAEGALFLPLMAASWWCNAWLDLLWPHASPCRDPHCTDEHCQLHVPDPIEEDGEHGLFA